MPWTWQAVFSSGVLRPAWIVVTVVLAIGYAAALHRGRHRGELPVRTARIISFYSGLALLIFTVSSAFDVYSMAVFWVHMIEHLLLIMAVPALLVLGHPLTVIRAAVGPERADPVLLSWPVSIILHPLVGLAIYTAVLFGTHLTHFMDQMSMHPMLMGVERVLYVVSGYLLFITLIGKEPIRWNLPQLARFLLILIAMSPDTIVGIVLMQSNDPFPMYLSMRPSWAPPAGQDVLTAGGIMWAGGDGLMMVIGLFTIADILISRERGTLLGSWLEGTRHAVIAEQLRAAGEDYDADADIDDDDAALAAYNQMLARLNGHPPAAPGDQPHT
jgi:putative copper resistance protein D